MASASASYSSYSSGSDSSYGYSSESPASVIAGPLRIRPRPFHVPLLTATAVSASSLERLVLDREEVSVLERCFGSAPIGATILILCDPQEWRELSACSREAQLCLLHHLALGP